MRTTTQLRDDQVDDVVVADASAEIDTAAEDQVAEVDPEAEDIGEVEGEAGMRDMIGYIARMLVDETRCRASPIRLVGWSTSTSA